MSANSHRWTEACHKACYGLTHAHLEQLGAGGVARLMRDMDALLVALKEIRDLQFSFEAKRVAREAIAQAEATK